MVLGDFLLGAHLSIPWGACACTHACVHTQALESALAISKARRLFRQYLVPSSHFIGGSLGPEKFDLPNVTQLVSESWIQIKVRSPSSISNSLEVSFQNITCASVCVFSN